MATGNDAQPGVQSGCSRSLFYSVSMLQRVRIARERQNPGAFLLGWPVAIADLDPNLLPDIGDGASNGPRCGHGAR